MAGLVACVSTSASAQNVHDFHFSSFEADYYLSKDEEGRAHLRVVERLTAEFPDRNQNFVSDGRVPAGHTVSMVLNFEPDSFESYTAGAADVLRRILDALPAVGLSLAGVAYVLWVRFTRGRDAESPARVTPEFAPPADMSLALADGVYHRKGSKKLAPALLVDLAIRGNARLIESERKRLLGTTSTEHSAELLSTEGLRDVEREFVRAVFGAETPGTRYTFKSNDGTLAAKLRTLQVGVSKSIVAMGYRETITMDWTPYVLTIAAMALGGFAIASDPAPLNVFTEWRATGFVAGVAGLLAVVVGSLEIRPLTQEGRRLYDYLQGLKMYMKADEGAVQSPESIGKTPMEVSDTAQAIDLHEKLLPYAILFDLEKDWLRLLKLDYEKTSRKPHWYLGPRPFIASHFLLSVNKMVSSLSDVTAPDGVGGLVGGGLGPIGR